jgi:hypothetical protein
MMRSSPMSIHELARPERLAAHFADEHLELCLGQT